MEELSRRGSLEVLGLTPFLCGVGGPANPYGASIQDRLVSACPDSVLEKRFLGAKELASLYSETALNIHPCAYDAYGMTVVEAASQVGSASRFVVKMQHQSAA